MTVWKQWENWTYEYFELDTDSSVFTGGEDFVDLWHHKRGDRQMPLRSAYDWDDFAPWWGSVILTDYHWDPFDYRYRLFGTKAVERFGTDVTGQLGSVLNGGEYVVGYDMEFYEFVARNQYISRTSGTIHWQNREHIETVFIELQLSDDEGGTSNGLSLML